MAGGGRRALGALAVALAVPLMWGPLGHALLAVVDWARSAGWVGVVVVVLAFQASAMLAVPASWPQMAIGSLYGLGGGFVVAWVASVASGVLLASLSRTLLRRRVLAALDARAPWLWRLDARISEDALGWVVLLRLPPVAPFHLVSYALGATGVPLRDVALGTALGGVLPVVSYVWVGASVTELSRVLEGGGSEGPGFWATGAVTLAVTAVVTARVRRELRALEGREEPPP